MENPFEIIGILLVIVGLIDIFLVPRILEKKIEMSVDNENKEKAKAIMNRVLLGVGLITAILGLLFIIKILP